MPKSRTRRKDDFTPPPSRKPVKFGSGRWVAPTMVTLFLVGLGWIVVFYLAGTSVPVMKSIDAIWNVLIGFAFIAAGFVVSTRWQ